MTSLSLCLAAVLMGTNFTQTTPKTPDPVATGTVYQIRGASAIERQMANMVNAERWERNLSLLRENPKLSAVARQHSREMAMLRYFDHYSPISDNKSPMKRYLRYLGYTPSYACVSENIYYCSKASIHRGHQALMNSASHRANILSEKFSEVGIGCYVAPDGSLYVTQMFLRQVDRPLYNIANTTTEPQPTAQS